MILLKPSNHLYLPSRCYNDLITTFIYQKEVFLINLWPMTCSFSLCFTSPSTQVSEKYWKYVNCFLVGLKLRHSGKYGIIWLISIFSSQAREVSNIFPVFPSNSYYRLNIQIRNWYSALSIDQERVRFEYQVTLYIKVRIWFEKYYVYLTILFTKYYYIFNKYFLW